MPLQPGELLIDDSNWQLFADAVPSGQGRGRVPRDYRRIPHGALPGAQPFILPEIPRSEWSERIKEMEATKSRLSDLMIQAGVPSLDQDGTNYCWCNGVVTAILGVRAVNNQPFVQLSPASVAAPVKNFRNDGGWGGEALEYIVEHGVAAASLWPPNAIDRRYWTAEAKANALLHRVTEWYDLRSRSFAQKMTCLLMRIPVPSGYNWWSHETCGIDPVEIEPGHFGSRERNSWGGSYGQDGYFVLAENKSTPDDAVAPRVVIPSVT